MSLNPEECAHCSSAYAMTKQAFEVKMPPPDAIKSALLLGLIIGQGQFMGTIDEMPCCDVCREQLEHLKASVYQGMESAEAAAGEGDEVSGEEVSGEPQPETEDEPAVMNDEPG